MLQYIAMFFITFLTIFVIGYLVILILQMNAIFLFLIGIAVIIAVQIVCTAVLVNTIRNKGQRMSGASDSMVQDLSCNQKGESA